MKLLYIYLLIFAITCSVNSQESGSNVTQLVFQLIQDGLNEQPAHPSGKAIVLIGLTGSGKTTLAKFITGNNSRLVSVAASGQSEPPPCVDPDPDDDYYDYDGGPVACPDEESAKEYYIKDLDDDKIGNDITISKTFYPDMFVDQTTGEVLVDCPGFADTRSESHEIAIAVFMRNIFKWARQTKVVIVVNYADVTRTGGRNEFRNLLRFVTIMLKNYATFNTSLGLVVTKVTNEYNSNQKLVSDEAMIGQIAEFIGSVREELLQQDPDDAKLQVLATLLKQIGRLYPNIGIFRRPYQEGPLSTIAAIQAGKKKIRKLVFSNLDYTNSTEADVGFAISSASEAVVVDLCEMIKSDIESLLRQLTERFTDYYQDAVKVVQSYEQLTSWLKRESGYFKPLSLNQDAALECQIEWFFAVLVKHEAESRLSIESIVESIKSQTFYLDFLKDLTSSPKAKPNETWKGQVPFLIQYVGSLSDWYEFLMSIFDRFSQNEVQSKKTALNFEYLKHWPVFKNLILSDLKYPEFKSISNKTSLDPQEQESLENVLHIVLDDPVGRPLFTGPGSCELVIEGNFVRISDFNSLSSLCGGHKITALYYFARFTVFFDTNLDKEGSEMLIGVVTPTWEVTGASQRILVNGHSGQQVLAQSNMGDGIAGYPGGPSGTFFGLGKQFINAVALQIHASGGNGGSGQMGQNGVDGHADIDPNVVHDRACVRTLYCGSCKTRNYEFDIDRIKYKMEQVRCSRHCTLCCPEYWVKFSIIDGPGPTSGFNGGKQGLGGRHSTTSQLIGVDGTHEVQLFSRDGGLGSVGQGGKGGLGGVKNGAYTTDIVLTCYGHTTLKGIRDCRRWSFEPGTRAGSASDGMSNVAGYQFPPQPAQNHQTYPVISKYRQFLVDQWLKSNKSMDNSDVEFLRRITEDPAARNLIDLHDLAYEFIALDHLHQRSPEFPSWTLVYDFLLQSIEAGSGIERNSHSPSFVVVANYLSAAVLSTKLGIEYQFDRNLIVDIRPFFDEVTKQIAKLANLNHRARLGVLKTIYDEDIIRKQREADQFLKNRFAEEMSMVEKRIDTSIQRLLKDVDDLLKQLEADREVYIKKIKEAQTKLIFNMIFGFLGVVAKFAKMAGPKGAAIESVLDAGVGFGQKFTKPGTGKLPSTKIPEAIDALNRLNREIELENRAKILGLEDKLGKVSSTNPVELQVLSGAKQKLAILSENSTEFTKIQAEVAAELDRLRKQHEIVESDLLDKVQTIIHLTRPQDVVAYEQLYEATQSQTKSRSSSSEIKKLKEGLKEVEANIKKVSAYKQFVDDSLSSYLKNLIELMVSIEKGARDSSAIALEISRFDMQKVFIQVRSIINKYTAGFEANEELIMCIDILDSLMQTTINLYDQIQTYNDQLNLGDLITQINEAGLSELHVNDSRLDSAIKQLDHAVVTRTIQNQHARVTQAFQQLVFPFARLFLTDTQPLDAGLSDEDMMQLMLSRLDNLQSKINDLQSSVIKGYDDQLFSYVFDDNKPFYVWTEGENRQAIKDLLQGGQVTLKADVKNSVANAVKFNDIRLKFVVTNTSEQHRLDAILEPLNIRLTHAGNSYYKCGPHHFVIGHQSQVIEFSVSVDVKGEPLSSNVAYKKIRDGNSMLSPYTLWKVQLVDRFKHNLDLWSDYYGNVQLKLTGKGQYIKEANPICEHGLEKFYQRI